MCQRRSVNSEPVKRRRSKSLPPPKGRSRQLENARHEMHDGNLGCLLYLAHRGQKTQFWHLCIGINEQDTVANPDIAACQGRSFVFLQYFRQSVQILSMCICLVPSLSAVHAF